MSGHFLLQQHQISNNTNEECSKRIVKSAFGEKAMMRSKRNSIFAKEQLAEKCYFGKSAAQLDKTS